MKLSIKMKSNDLILPTCVSFVTETIASIECLKQGLSEKFDVLRDASNLNKSKKMAVYGAENVAHDMLIINGDAWPS